MNYPYSNPDLNNMPLRRQSRRRQSRNSRELKLKFKPIEFKISNPVRAAQQENLYPVHIRDCLGAMEYISSNSIKDIEIPESVDVATNNNKRESIFSKNIQMMQQLAKLQQQKYTQISQAPSASTNPKDPQSQQLSFLNINMSQDDRISLELNGFYDYKERVDDDFDIFQREPDVAELEGHDRGQWDYPHHNQQQNDLGYAGFYSQRDLEPTSQMDEQFNNYLK